MPCPFFEPTGIAPDPQAAHARLPLLAEYDGLCHAQTVAVPSPHDWRFAGCNHGRDQKQCPRFPAGHEASSRRFTLQAKSDSTLSVLVSEEVDHTPVRWRQVSYFISSQELLEASTDECESAQIRAFCQTYLSRFIDCRREQEQGKAGNG